MKLLYYFIAAIVCAGIAHHFEYNILDDVFAAVFGALLIALIDFISNANARIGLLITGHTKYRKKYVRFSISYLYKINVYDKYLLVKGHRIEGQFQPVGGVIKRFAESNHFFTEMGILDDQHLPIDDISKDDLRVLVPGKNIINFINWFESRKGREISYEREFREELIEEGILSSLNFKTIPAKLLKTHETRIRYSPHFQCPEILIAEILELMPTSQQLDELKRLMDVESEKYIWATADTIKRLGHNVQGKSCRISDTALWTL